MHILIVTDSPTFPSSYGSQIGIIAPLLQSKLGHKITLFAPDVHGQSFAFEGVRVLPGSDTLGGPRMFGAELIQEHADYVHADLILTYKDPYAFPAMYMSKLQTPWVAQCSVDTIGLSRANKEVLHYAAAVIAVARDGERSLKRAGIAPVYYIPHGYNPAVFRPISEAQKKAIRKELHIPLDTFVAIWVGDNRTDPSRKSLEQLLIAWRSFAVAHPDAVLQLHTNLTGDRGGVDVDLLLDDPLFADIPASSIRATDQYHYSTTGLSPAGLAKMYQASDVLFSPSTGEGFDIPLMEAQACGLPVMAVKITAMTENVFAGVLLNTDGPDYGEKIYNFKIGGWRWRPATEAITQGIFAMYEGWRLGKFAAPEEISKCVFNAYNNEMVIEKYWKPVLEDIERWLLKGELK